MLTVKMSSNSILANGRDAAGHGLESLLPADIVLRPATQADGVLCEVLFIEQYQGPLQFAGWNDSQCRAHLQPQFAMREQQFRERYPQADHDIIEVDGSGIGRLLVSRRQQVVNIIDMVLLPAWRGRGIGSHLLQQLCNEADETGKVLELHVACDNPAVHLYQRSGFKMSEDQGVYLLMRRAPESAH